MASIAAATDQAPSHSTKRPHAAEKMPKAMDPAPRARPKLSR